MSTITINNVSVAAAAVANDIGAASGADTAAKVKTIIGTTDAELNQLENIVASGIDAIPDGSVYRRTSDAEVTQVENIIASGVDAIKDGSVYRRTSDAEVTKIENIIASGLDAVQNGGTYGRTTLAGAADANSIAGAAGAAVADRLLTLVKTVDGAGSGLDADLLDGKTTGTTSASGIVPVTLGSGKLDNSFLNNASATVSGISSIISVSGIVTGTDNTQFMTASGLKGSLASDGMWLTKRTKMPDVAGSGNPVYSQDAFGIGSVGADGWSGNYGTRDVTSTTGAIRVTAGASNADLFRNTSGIGGKVALCRMRASTPVTISIRPASGGSTEITTVNLTTAWSVFSVLLPTDAAAIRLYATTFASGSWFELDWCWIGDLDATTKALYTTGTLSEEAARIADQLADSAGVGVAASGTITSNGTALTAGDTITIGGKVYTAVDTLTGADGEILVNGISAADIMTYLSYAINKQFASTYNYGGSTPRYSVTAEHPLVRASTTSLTMTLTAGKYSTGTVTGELGNNITMSKTTSVAAVLAVANASTSTTVNGTSVALTGGYSDAAAKMSTAVANASQGLTAKTSGVQADYELILDSAAGFVKKKVLKSNLETTTQAAGKRALYNSAAGLNANSISFPAVQVASADANTLDDYEEGTWTPILYGGTTEGSPTYSRQVGWYTKKGREVTIGFGIRLTNLGGVAGDLKIKTLPFQAASTTYVNHINSVLMVAGVTLAANFTSIKTQISAGDSIITLYRDGSGQSAAIVQHGEFSDTAWIVGEIIYHV